MILERDFVPLPAGEAKCSTSRRPTSPLPAVRRQPGGMRLPESSRPGCELDSNREIVAVCKVGARGAQAAQILQKAGFSRVANLNGGIRAWAERVDPSVPKY